MGISSCWNWQLVIGDNLGVEDISDEEIDLEMGSSPVSEMTDRVLTVIAHEPLMGCGLDRNCGDHRFDLRHKVVLSGLSWSEGGELLAFDRIRIGMFGHHGDLRISTIMAAWEHLGQWS